MVVRKTEPHLAVETLEEFHSQLTHPSDYELRQQVERIIKTFKTSLFAALVEIQELTEDTLLNERIGMMEKISETSRLADIWENRPPLPSRKTIQKEVNSGFRTIPRQGSSSSNQMTASSSASSQHVKPTLSDPNIAPREHSTGDIVFDEHGQAWEMEEIILDPGSAGLGFSIAGGTEADHDPSIYVTNIIHGGAAAADGRMRVDDIIIRVNSTDCRNVSHDTVRDALMRSKNTVFMTLKRRREDRDRNAPSSGFPLSKSVSATSLNPIQRPMVQRNSPYAGAVQVLPPPPARPMSIASEPYVETSPGLKRIQLFKVTGGLGFSISGGVNNEQLPNDNGIYVTNIIDGGNAHRDGRLEVGDKLLSVDNVPFNNVTHHFALEVLRSTGNKVEIVCVHNPIVWGLICGGTPQSVTTPLKAPSLANLSMNDPHTPQLQHGTPTSYQGTPQREPVPLYPRTTSLVRGNVGGLGFNIIGGEDNEPVYISNVMSGGVAEQSGGVHKGDILLAVNGVNLENATHVDAVNALKNAQNPVLLTLQYRPHECELLERKLNEMKEQKFYVRTLFEYDPNREVGTPPRTMGFEYGDILHITNDADDDWWTARKVAENGDEGPEGVIPSKRRVEKREKARRRQVGFRDATHSLPRVSGMEGRRGSKSQLSFSRRFPFVKSTDKINEMQDNEPFVATDDSPVFSYQIVEKQPVNYTRPVVILGALKERINDELAARFPDRFEGCVPHTSRPPRDDEVDGRDYHFVNKYQMEDDVSNNLFIEAGHYQDNLYGTSVNAVRSVMNKKKHCLLSVAPNAIRRLQKLANLHPIAIFIKPNGAQQILDWDPYVSEEQAHDQIQQCQRIEQNFGDVFTYVCKHGVSFEDVISQVLQMISSESRSAAFVSSP